MLKVENKIVYKAFGLSIISEIPLPELPCIDNEVNNIDIEIKIGDLSKIWSQLSNQQNKFLVYENRVLFQVPKIATFSITDGKTIIVSPLKEYDEDHSRLYILGTCMGALLIQRKIIPLHGSAVAINGKAYAIIGESGAGKSTLASGFIKQGYDLLSDDVIAISLSAEEKTPFVTPSYPQQKLWQDSLKNFSMDKSHYQSIFGRENKYCVPVTSNYCGESLPLAGVFELVKTQEKDIVIRDIDKLKQFYTFYCHTYRNFLIPRLGLMNWHFNTFSNIVNKIDVYQIHRPVSEFNTPQLVSIILNQINKGE